ncbi:HNH endonuclease signature motif containing protein [Streptomyces cinnamoneus]
MRAVKPIEERLFSKVDATGICWLWTGAINRGGYGAISKGRREGAAIVHRVVWELLVGPIPNGADLDHLCRVRACCNPDHLEPVTRVTNVARGSRRAGAPRRTHCKRGHAFTPENSIPNGPNGRSCRICTNEANRRYRARKKDA